MKNFKNKQSLINAIETIANTASILGNEYVSGTPLANLSVTKIHYLTLIKELDFPTITKLAKDLNVTKPTVTNTVNSLIDQGLITKKQAEQDKRIFYLFLTKKGETAYLKRKEVSQYFSELMFSSLNDQEINLILNILDKILLNIRNQKALSISKAGKGALTNE